MAGRMRTAGLAAGLLAGLAAGLRRAAAGSRRHRRRNPGRGVDPGRGLGRHTDEEHRRELGARAAVAVREQYTAEVMARRAAEVYRRVCPSPAEDVAWHGHACQARRARAPAAASSAARTAAPASGRAGVSTGSS